MTHFPWMKRKKTDPEIPYEPPIPIGKPLSNGEFYLEPTERDLAVREEILKQCDENARRVGWDRREFIASAMGMCTTLAVMNACGSSGGDGSGGSGGSAGAAGSGGMPPEACTDEGVAIDLLAGDGDEFIIDLQTHHIEDEEHWRESHPGTDYPGPGIAQVLDFLSNPRDPTNIDNAAYLKEIFLDSETAVAVLSGFPSEICEDDTYCNSPISNSHMAISRDEINAMAGSQRMVQHCQVAPNDQWERQARNMERIRQDFGNHGWKCYPPWGPLAGGNRGWWMDDAMNMRDGREPVANALFQKVVDLTPSAPEGSDPMVYPQKPLLCAHKGFVIGSFEALTADPVDVGPAASAWPEIEFVIYHSGVDSMGGDRGAYDPNATDLKGIDRLVKTVEDHGLKGKNVYAELGSAWFLVMGDMIGRQHFLGKLLKHLGEDNVLWGTECTWFGSPQRQIEVFRTTEISQELQDLHGYPALTPEIKRKILGGNAAKLYNIDVDAVRCKVQDDELTRLRRRLDEELGPRRWAFQQMGGPRTRREFMRLQKWRAFKGVPA